jgi:hypothetical protein
LPRHHHAAGLIGSSYRRIAIENDKNVREACTSRGVNMGNATARSFAELGAIFNHAAGAPKPEPDAANETSGSAANGGAKLVAPMVLCGDDVRQGVTGHNVRYVLGFGLLGAIVALAVVAFVVGHGSAMPPL